MARIAKPPTSEELITVKKCKKCHVVKPLIDFYRLKVSKDGREASCIACRNAVFIEKTTTMKKGKLPRVKGVKHKQGGAKTKCVQCRSPITSDIRFPSHPVGTYQINCSTCGAALLMGLI